MSKKISVIIKEPGKNPRHVNISDSHKNLENTVGGTVAEIILCTDLVVLFRQEQEGLPRCCNIAGKNLLARLCSVASATRTKMHRTS